MHLSERTLASLPVTQKRSLSLLCTSGQRIRKLRFKVALTAFVSCSVWVCECLMFTYWLVLSACVCVCVCGSLVDMKPRQFVTICHIVPNCHPNKCVLSQSRRVLFVSSVRAWSLIFCTWRLTLLSIDSDSVSWTGMFAVIYQWCNCVEEGWREQVTQQITTLITNLGSFKQSSFVQQSVTFSSFFYGWKHPESLQLTNAHVRLL